MLTRGIRAPKIKGIVRKPSESRRALRKGDSSSHLSSLASHPCIARASPPRQCPARGPVLKETRGRRPRSISGTGLIDGLAARPPSKALSEPPGQLPVAMLKPGHGRTHRAYLWSYCTTQFKPVKAVVFDFADSRGRPTRKSLPRLARRSKAGAARLCATTSAATRPASGWA